MQIMYIHTDRNKYICLMRMQYFVPIFNFQPNQWVWNLKYGMPGEMCFPRKILEKR